MAYTVSRAGRTIWWPVSIRIPMDGGKVETFEMEMQLVVPTKSQAREAVKLDEAAFEQYMLDRVKDWRNEVLLDEETGAPIPYSRENLQALLEHGWFEVSLSRALAQANAGVAAAKN
jgi:hypothetical protein